MEFWQIAWKRRRNIFSFPQVGTTRKTVQRSQGYPCTWWSAEHSEPCSWCCSSTRRYSRGGRKCPLFHPTGPKFPSWNWSSSCYHASCSAGSWWVSRGRRNFLRTTRHSCTYVRLSGRYRRGSDGQNLIVQVTSKALLPISLPRWFIIMLRNGW